MSPAPMSIIYLTSSIIINILHVCKNLILHITVELGIQFLDSLFLLGDSAS